MKTTLKWTLCCLGICALAGPSFGQSTYPVTPGETPAQTSSDRQAGKSTQFHRSKDLVGANVMDTQNQKIGDINEIVVNPRSHQIFAVIDLGDRNALVPLQALTISPARGALRNAEVTLNKTKQAVESGPTITNDQWNQLDNPAFAQRIYSHYNVRAPSGVGGASDDAMGGASAGSDSSASDKKSDSPSTPTVPPRQ